MYPHTSRRPLSGLRPSSLLRLRRWGLVLGALCGGWVLTAQAAKLEGSVVGKAEVKAEVRAAPKADAKAVANAAASGAQTLNAANAPKAPAAAPAPALAKLAALPAAPVEAPATDVDPMERLQRRLGERLTTAKPTSSVAGPLEVRVLAKPPADGAKGKPGATSTAALRGTAKAPASATRGLPWSFEGATGPQAWGTLKPDYTLCAKGQRQSPIDIQGGLPVELDPLQFSYQATPFSVLDNGYTVQATLGGGNFIEVSGQRFELKHLQFRRPSEERIDGRQFDMSLHLVHQDNKGRLAVVSVLLDRASQPHPALQKVWNSLPLEKHQERPSRMPLELQELLPEDKGYYTYMGSLTTPPCTEGVQWIVMRQPLAVSAEQIELFARLYPMNARPVQQVAGRRILQTP